MNLKNIYIKNKKELISFISKIINIYYRRFYNIILNIKNYFYFYFL